MEYTVGEFIELLKKYEPTRTLDFNGLDFYRMKDTGAVVFVEFNQTVYKNEIGNVVVENH